MTTGTRVREYFDGDLLERFRPQLRYDRQYDYLATAVETMVENDGNLLRRWDGEVIAKAGGEPALSLALLASYPHGHEPAADDCLCQAPDARGDARRMERDPRYPARVYGRVVDDGGRRWLQYWFWLYYNPKHLFGFGKHEGDWEMIQVGLGADDRPELLTYAQHDSGESRRASDDDVEAVANGDGLHPVVYVAPLSHASYFKARAHPYLVGIDHPYGDGPRVTPPVSPFCDWVHFPGRWGNSERAFAGRVGNGPPSPAHQGRKWDSPDRFHRSMRRRAFRVLLGRAVHGLGRLTFPPAPEVEARLEEDGVQVSYRLAGRGVRKARHLQLTVHDGDAVIASRTVRGAARAGSEKLLLADVPAGCLVIASAFNRLRQRSALATVRPAL